MHTRRHPGRLASYLHCLLALSFLLLCFGCRSAGHPGLDAAASGAITPDQAFPSLPAPSELRREAATVPFQFFRAAAYPYGVMARRNVDTMNSEYAVLSPGSESPGPAICGYDFFNRGAVNGSDTLHFEWETPPAESGQFWVALADFSANRWVWLPGPSPSETLDFSAMHEQCVAEDGCLYVYVLIQPGPPCSLRFVQLGDSQNKVTLAAVPDKGTLELETTLTAQYEFYGISTSSIDWDLDGDGVFELTGTATLTMPASFSNPGTYTPAVRFNLVKGGAMTASTTAQVFPFGNVGPSVFIEADVLSGDAPLTVHLDASASADFDTDDPLSFEWDLDGDGEFELHTGEIPGVTATLGLAGMHTLRVRVRDVEGFSATESLDVEVVHGWKKQQIPDSSSARPDFSLANIGSPDPTPALAASKEGQQSLFFFRSLTESGSNFAAPAEIVIGQSAYQPNLAEVDGLPAMAYEGPSSINYIRALDSTGVNWGDPVLVESSMESCSNLAVIGGKPALVGTHMNETLFYFRGLDAAGTVWAPGEIVYNPPDGLQTGPARLSSLAGSRPWVFFGSRGYVGLVQDYGSYSTLGSDSQGSSFEQPQRVFKNFSIDIAIAGNGNQTYALGADSWYPLDGLLFSVKPHVTQDWSRQTQLNSMDAAGRALDLALVDNLPLVAFTNADSWDSPPQLFVMQALDSNAEQWEEPQAIEVHAAISDHIRLLRTPAGTPLLVYRDLDEQCLVAAYYE